MESRSGISRELVHSCSRNATVPSIDCFSCQSPESILNRFPPVQRPAFSCTRCFSNDCQSTAANSGDHPTSEQTQFPWPLYKTQFEINIHRRPWYYSTLYLFDRSYAAIKTKRCLVVFFSNWPKEKEKEKKEMGGWSPVNIRTTRKKKKCVDVPCWTHYLSLFVNRPCFVL